MIVTGMFVAEVARASEGKLNVLGGVIDWIQTEAIGTETPEPVRLVVLVQREKADDAEQGTVRVEAFAPNGDKLLTADMQFDFPAGSENGFLAMTLPLPVPTVGRYSFVASASGTGKSTAMALRFEAAGP